MIKVYRDDAANSIFLEDANGSQFPNSLQATINPEDNTKISIIDLAKQVDIVSNEIFSEFVNENEEQYGIDGTQTVNALNAEFVVSGTSGSELPEITSPLSINAVSGEIINYELTADFGVGYEWSGLPNGLVNAEGNIRKILGSLPSGIYTPSMSAVNYNGTDTQTLTINVSNPPFSNTKSINFVNNDYLNGNPISLQSTLARPSNGSGASDAWSISLYFKPSTSNNSEQTILYYGSSSESSGGGLRLTYNGSNDRIELLYGNIFNNLEIRSTNNSLTTGTWSHILVTYDGGTTGVGSGEVNDYYGRFKIFIDGTEVTYNNTNSNFGWNSAISTDIFRVGRYISGSNMRNNCRVDELAIFDSDQQLNITSIYNSGQPFDLTTLPVPPNNWWRMGDGDTYPTLQDSVGTSNLSMVNMTSADIVNDTP